MTTTTPTRAQYAVSFYNDDITRALRVKAVGPKPFIVISGTFDSEAAFTDAVLATGAPFSRYDIANRRGGAKLRRTPELPTDGELYIAINAHPEDATDWLRLVDVNAPKFHALAGTKYVTVVKECGHNMTANVAHSLPEVGERIDCGAACSGGWNAIHLREVLAIEY